MHINADLMSKLRQYTIPPATHAIFTQIHSTTYDYIFMYDR